LAESGHALEGKLMRVLKEEARHDRLERWLAQQLIAVVREKLASSGLPSDTLGQLTREIAVGVADLWDGCHGLEIDGEMLSPFLVFAVDNDEEDVLVRSYNDTGSFLHERVAQIANQA
jgi:hypothetical protein